MLLLPGLGARGDRVVRGPIWRETLRKALRSHQDFGSSPRSVSGLLCKNVRVTTPVGSSIRASFLPFRGKKFGNAEMHKDPKLNMLNTRGLGFLHIPCRTQVHHLLLSTNRALEHDHLLSSLVQTELAQLTQLCGAESGCLAPWLRAFICLGGTFSWPSSNTKGCWPCAPCSSALTFSSPSSFPIFF